MHRRCGLDRLPDIYQCGGCNGYFSKYGRHASFYKQGSLITAFTVCCDRTCNECRLPKQGIIFIKKVFL